LLLQDHRVEEWVTHGLNLPQYAAAFRQAAITALDFPLLVSDGGATLGQELGVSSRLHQQQVRLALKVVDWVPLARFILVAAHALSDTLQAHFPPPPLAISHLCALP
jgi:hypothetical protein